MSVAENDIPSLRGHASGDECFKDDEIFYPNVEAFDLADLAKLSMLNLRISRLFSEYLAFYTVLNPETMEFSPVSTIKPEGDEYIYAPTILFSYSMGMMLIVAVPVGWMKRSTMEVNLFMNRVLDFMASTNYTICLRCKTPSFCAVCNTLLESDPVHNYVKTISGEFFLIVCVVRCPKEECEKFAQTAARTVCQKVFSTVAEVKKKLDKEKEAEEIEVLEENEQVRKIGEFCYEDEICRWCGKKKASFVCARCRSIHYCDVECQKKHWSEHSEWCSSLKKEKMTTCAACRRKPQKLMKCACGSVYYCGKECQMKDWNEKHKNKCTWK